MREARSIEAKRVRGSWIALAVIPALFSLTVGCGKTKNNQDVLASAAMAQYYQNQQAQQDLSRLRDRNRTSDTTYRGPLSGPLQTRFGSQQYAPGQLVIGNNVPCRQGLQSVYGMKDGKWTVTDTKKCKEDETAEKKDKAKDDADKSDKSDREDESDSADKSKDKEAKNTIRMQPRWEEKCFDELKLDRGGDDYDGDGITNECELAMKKEFPSLDPEVFNGYKIGAVKLDEKSFPFQNKDIFSKVGRIFTNPSAFNSAVGQMIVENAGSLKNSPLEVLKNLYDKGKDLATQIPIHQTVAERNVGGDAEQVVALIKGGFDEPILYRPDPEEGEPFTFSSFTGLVSNYASNLEGDTQIFVYVAEAKVDKRALDLFLGQVFSDGSLLEDARESPGAFIVTQDGEIVLSNIDFKNIHGSEKVLGNLVPKRKGKWISGSKESHLVLGLIAGEVKGKEATRILENILVSLDRGQTKELLPQEIAKAEGIEKKGARDRKILADVTSAKDGSSPSTAAVTETKE